MYRLRQLIVARLLSADGKTLIKGRHNGRLEIWREYDDKPARVIEFEGLFHQISLSSDGTLAATHMVQGNDVVQIWDVARGDRVASLETKLSKPSDGSANTDPFIMEFSNSNRFLLVTHQIWDISIRPPKRIWQAEPDHATTYTFQHPEFYRWGVLLPDERHVVVGQDAQFQVWDFVKNEKKATLYLLPDDGWAWVNHRNGHWNGSLNAANFLRIVTINDYGKEELLSPREYELRAHWKNKPEKAGIDARTPSSNRNSP